MAFSSCFVSGKSSEESKQWEVLTAERGSGSDGPL